MNTCHKNIESPDKAKSGVKLLSWSKVVTRDMPEQPQLTNAIRDETTKEATRFRGSVRLVTGTFWTDEEYERLRKEVMETPLP